MSQPAADDFPSTLYNEDVPRLACIGPDFTPALNDALPYHR